VFSRHSRRLRKADVFSVDGLIAELKASYQMPGADFPEPKVTVLKEAADTGSWLLPNVNKFEGFMKTHQFQFYQVESEGERFAVMRTKKYAFYTDDHWTEPARVLKVRAYATLLSALVQVFAAGFLTAIPTCDNAGPCARQPTHGGTAAVVPPSRGQGAQGRHGPGGLRPTRCCGAPPNCRGCQQAVRLRVASCVRVAAPTAVSAVKDLVASPPPPVA